MDALEQTLKLAEPVDDKPLLANLHNKLCVTRQRLGDLDQATEHCQQALALAEALGNQRMVGMTLNNLGNIASDRGNRATALEFYRKNLAVREALGDKNGMASSLNNLGVIYHSLGNTMAALEHYLRSLKLVEETGNKAPIALALNNVGIIYRERGNYQLALEYSQRSLTLSEAIGNNTMAQDALAEIGKIYGNLGNYAQALEWARKSLARAEATREKSAIIKRLLSVGNTYRWFNDYQQASDYLRRGLALAESAGEPYLKVVGLYSLSQVCLQQGRAAEALELAERSVAQAQQLGTHKEYWEALSSAGAALRALKQPEHARQRFAEAINVIETARNQLAASESEQAGFFGFFSDPYQQMAMLLAEQGQPSEAFEFAERVKARVLLDVLQSGKGGIHKAMSAAEQQQEWRLRDEMTALHTQLRGATETVRPDTARVNELKAKVQKARLTYDAFQSQLYLAHPELKIQRGEAHPIKAADAAALLPRREMALLEFVVTDEATWLFTLTQAASGVELKAFPLAIKRDELAKLTNDFRQQLAELDLKFRPAAKQLYDLLLKPAQAQLAGKTQLIIVPDGKLWELPFQALVTPKN